MLLTLAGAGVLLLVACDVYLTILHARGRSGPVSDLLTRAIWSASRGLAFRLGRPRRHRFLNAVGPLVMPLIILLLVILLVVGFAMIYAPRMPEQFAIDREAASASPWITSLYFSGATVTTIGYGDVAPRSPGMRLVALVEGASGLTLISLTVSYLVSVSNALERKRVLAISFYHQAEGGSDAVGYLLHHFVRGRFIGIEANLRTAAYNLQSVLESHIEHPVIHYFHPLQVYKGLPRVIFLALEIVSVVRSCADRREYEDLRDHPDVRTLATSALQVLDSFCRLLRVKGPARPRHMTAGQTARWRARFDQTVSRLEAAGVKIEPDREAAWRAYQERRAEWEASLRALAHHLGYDWDEVTGDDDLSDATREADEPSRIRPLDM